jgi:RNA polymerase sigma-70 factor (ECF subfamily)
VEDFFRSEFVPLVAFLCKSGLVPALARDVAAEALLQAAEAWPPAGDPRVWVRLAAARVADEQAWLDDGPAGEEDDKLTALVEQNARVIEVLATLPDTQRTVLVWSLDDFTQADIAAALRMPAATVRSNLRHARDRLRRRATAHSEAPMDQEEAVMAVVLEADAALLDSLRLGLDVEATLTRVKDQAREKPSPAFPAHWLPLDGAVTAAVAGDHRAAARLLEIIRPLVVRYCRGRVGGLERAYSSADDLAQEVCLAVLTALPSYRDQGRPFLAFVYGIAQHKVADAHRAAARNRTDPVPEPPERAAPGHGPEQLALQGELNDRLSQLLSVLPERQRDIVLLRVVVGLSAEETADAVDSTPGAVRVSQHRALLRLRRALSTHKRPEPGA